MARAGGVVVDIKYFTSVVRGCVAVLLRRAGVHGHGRTACRGLEDVIQLRVLDSRTHSFIPQAYALYTKQNRKERMF